MKRTGSLVHFAAESGNSRSDTILVVIARSFNAGALPFVRYGTRKKKQTAMHASSIHTELPTARIETALSLALELPNPAPAMGSASLAPKNAARTRLRMRTQNDAISEIAKGIAAQLAISN